MKIITSFLPCTQGKVTVSGYDVFADSLKVRQKIGYLPENCPLYMDLEVESFLKFVAEVRGIEPKKRKQAVEKVISDCDIKTVMKKVIGHLSKGYRQRVGLAQALIHNPDILVMDEPTAGLDPNQIRDILELIKNLGQEKTVIHSTHILREAEATVKRILIIHEGRIVGQGSTQELMDQAKGTTVYANIKGDNVIEKLNQAEFIKDASKMRELENGFMQCALHGKTDAPFSEEVFKLAVQNNWTLSELRSEAASLEDVFTRLTRG
jgi:ABC-2 type transport system ATP-binding protein